jgi:WD40 repeat protein/Ca2+-binding EF-hand superfamily protein
VYSTGTIRDVQELYQRFQRSVYGFALVEAQFESILAFNENISKYVNLETLFEVLDNDHDGRIDGLEFLGGLALCCQGTFEEKAKFCFQMYDFNLNAQMSRKEMTMMIMASICGMNLLTGGSEALEPSLETLEDVVSDAFNKADRDRSGHISFDEFVMWARSNRDIMAALETMNKLAMDAKLECVSEDSASDVEEGDLSDSEPCKERGKLSMPVSSRVGGGDEGLPPGDDVSENINEKDEEKNVGVYHQWRSQVYEPTNFVESAKLSRGPGVNLELAWAYGHRAQNSRSNVRYLITNADVEAAENIVYPTASIGIILNINSRQQRFYQGHPAEITAIALHPSGILVATGDAKSNIHLWNAHSMSCVSIIKGLVKDGIQHLIFSPSGSRIAAIHFDADSTVTLYNSSSGEIIASARGIPVPMNVFGAAYSPNGDEIVIVGTKQVKFFSKVLNTKRSLECKVGRIGRMGKKQTYFCVQYMENDAVVGCADGSLYRFSNQALIQVIQAHAINEPVLCMHYSARDGLLITGGKDSLVKSWDSTLAEVGTSLDMSEDLDGDGKADCGSLDSTINSVQMFKGKILIGTKGSDIFEAVIPMNMRESLALNRIGWGHGSGKLHGLGVHPVREEFATCGDDKTLRVWSIRSHEQINVRNLPTAARAVCYNSTGDVLCVGLEDGTTCLIEANTTSMRVYTSWKHSSDAITLVKFSRDGKFLVTASMDRNFYLYRSEDSRTYLRQAVCQGHSGVVMHVDFSTNCQYIASCCDKSAILFWDSRGNVIKDASLLRDETWASNGVRTTPFGWAVQGIAQNASPDNVIRTLCALPEVGDVVVGDSQGKLNLYRYPTIYPKSLSQTYSGHAGPVARIAPSANKRYLVSIGEEDRSILLWSHETELTDDSDEEEESYAPAKQWSVDASNKLPKTELDDDSDEEGEGYTPTNQWLVDAPNELPEASARSPLFEANTKNMPHAEVLALVKNLADNGELSIPKPASWLKQVMEPTARTGQDESYLVPGTTDVDLELKWTHGYRSHDCRNNLRYSSSGKIVYPAASLCVALNKTNGKQTFLQAAHTDEVISISAHPNGQIFASGEAGRCPIIVIWSSNDMRVLSRIEDSGQKHGIPLLAFNTLGNLLASCGMDECNTLVIHDWSNGIEIMRTSVNKGKVFCLAFLANPQAEDSGPGQDAGVDAQSNSVDMVVTGGHKHLSFWYSSGNNVKSQHGLWGKYGRKKETILSVVSPIPGVCVTSSAQGSVVIWDNYKASFEARHCEGLYCEGLYGIEYPHRSSVYTMWAVQGSVDEIDVTSDGHDKAIAGYAESCRILTGDRNGTIAVWRLVTSSEHNRGAAAEGESLLRLICMKVFNVKDLLPAPTTAPVRSLCERDGVLLIGLQGCDVYEVIDNSIPFAEPGGELLPAPPVAKASSSASGEAVPPAVAAATAVGEGGEAKGLSEGSAEEKTAVFPPVMPLNKDREVARGKVGKLRNAASNLASTIRCERLVSSHNKGELWGLASHPTAPFFFTSGDDRTIRCWSIEHNKMVSYLELPEKSRALDLLMPGGEDLAIALNSGAVWVVKTSLFMPEIGPASASRSYSGDQIKTPLSEESCRVLEAAGKRPIHEIKYSFDGSLLAVGSHDKCVYIYDVRKNYEQVGILRGQKSSVAHIDFGVMLTLNETCSQHYDVKTKKITTTKKQRAGFEGATGDAGSATRDVPSAGVLDEQKLAEAAGSTPATEESKTKAISDANEGEENKEGDAPTEEKKEEAVPAPAPVAVPPLATSKSLANLVSEKDLSMEDVCLQVADGDGTVYYYEFNKSQRCYTQQENSNKFRNVWWDKWSLPYGWPVQGIWSNEYDGTDVNSVARSHSYEEVPVLVTADNYGRVRLFDYPSVTANAPDKCYRGHFGHISRVVFSFDDRHCITIGGDDRCIFVWETDILDEIRERKALKTNALIEGKDRSAQDIEEERREENECALVPIKAYTVPGPGDESMAVKPWKSAIREPSNFKETDSIGEVPDASLELKYVYGYRGWDCRSNIGFAGNRSQVIYHIAAVGIVYNSKTHTQIHNTEHDDDIISLDCHPNGHAVATGEVGKKPKIVIWDAYTGVTIRVIMFHRRGVSNLAFSKCGELLVSAGMDDDRMIAVHNVNTGSLVGKGKAGRGIDILTIVVSKDGRFVTGGKGHIKFWELPTANAAGGELPCKGGIYNNKAIKCRTVVSSTFLGTDCITGMSDGTLLLWKDRSATKFTKAHNGAVMALCELPEKGSVGGTNDAGPRIVSGGRDGKIHIWSYKLAKIWSMDVADPGTSPVSSNPQIRAVATIENRLIFGTKASEIYELNLLTSELYRLCQGHFDERSETWGLCTHPSQHKFVTAGDDMTVRVWDGKAMKQTYITSLGKKARAVAYRPDGSHIAVGCYDGHVKVLSHDLTTEVADAFPSSSWIEALAYSPNSELLAVGTHDRNIYLLDTKTYSVREICKGHSSFITNLDFSHDNKYLQSSSGAYELLFWDAKSGKQEKSSTAVRDVKWATFTSTLGWPVQGIWPSGSDMSDVNSTDCSSDNTLIVTGDDFSRVKLFSYPAAKEHCNFKEFKGHSEHIPNVRFSHDSKYVYSVGGLDKAVMQFEVVRRGTGASSRRR